MGACFAIKLAETFFMFGRLSDSANDGGDMAHAPRPDKEGDMEACAPIPILCSYEADCPRFAKSPLPPWLTSERSREIGKCLRAASYLGFSQSCSFWKCGGNIAVTGLTNIAGSRSVIARSLGETSETKNPTLFAYLQGAVHQKSEYLQW